MLLARCSATFLVCLLFTFSCVRQLSEFSSFLCLHSCAFSSTSRLRDSGCTCCDIAIYCFYFCFCLWFFFSALSTTPSQGLHHSLFAKISWFAMLQVAKFPLLTFCCWWLPPALCLVSLPNWVTYREVARVQWRIYCTLTSVVLYLLFHFL